MSPKTSKIARYLGLGAAILVPALVVAQQQVNPPTVPFADNDILRASEVRQLRNALVEAIARINTLEQGAGSAITKASVYAIESNSEPAVQDAVALATASCLDGNDVLITCGCQGLLEGTNSPQFDLRRVEPRQQSDGTASTCVCQGVNVGSDVARILVARASCLDVP